MTQEQNAEHEVAATPSAALDRASGGAVTAFSALRKPSSVRVAEVETKKDLKTFVTFPMRLYSDCPQFVPPLISDEMTTLSRVKNPAFEQADAKLFLAMDDSRVVGRVAAIVSHAANRKHGARNLRFGWFDAVNDLGVARALFDAVEGWGRALGMETLSGPMGFDEFDRAGLLIEGFSSRSTMVAPYNYPYYERLVTECGFGKEIDAVEYVVPNVHKMEFPPRLAALVERVKARWGFRVLEFRSRKDVMARADEILDVIEETYWDLYDHVPLTDRQKAYYVRKSFPLLSKDLVKVVVDKQGDVAGFFLAMPSVAAALQKAKGRLLPFGAFHLWRAMRPGNKTLECLLAGVRKRYRGRGVDLIMASEMFRTAQAWGFEEAESNPELETNHSVQAEWKPFHHEVRRRRRFFKKQITSR